MVLMPFHNIISYILPPKFVSEKFFCLCKSKMIFFLLPSSTEKDVLFLLLILAFFS